MTKFKNICVVIIMVFVIFYSSFGKPVFAQSSKLDVIDFMRPKFNYNGFTELNSFLGQNIHEYATASGWTHGSELTTCPPELDGCVISNGPKPTAYDGSNIPWKARNMTRQKPGENILYTNKGAVPGINRVPETFWFNEDSIYDFSEAYALDPPNNGKDPSAFGAFHNYYLPSSENPTLDFPNRGVIWSKRYFTPGEDTTIPYNNVKIEDYFNMVLQCYMGSQCYWDGAAKGTVKLTYYPNWDSSLNTFNGKPDMGNLPAPLEVIVNESSNTDASGIPIFTEKYFYARNGSNSFGLIRYERWDPKTQVCGNYAPCCTQTSCDGSLALDNYNTFNILMHYDPGEDPDQYFTTSYYADPKLEAYPGKPSNGAISRSRFQLPGNGMTTDGKALAKGAWMQLTGILTDADWMISGVIPGRHCPDGYQYIGSLATNFYDYKDQNQGYGWAEFCGTNKNVVLSETCPADYSSRGWFDDPTTTTSAYDYQGNDVSGKRINYCVHYNEFHFPKLTSTPIPTPTYLPGDINKDHVVNIQDYILLSNAFGTNNTAADLNSDGTVNIQDYIILSNNFGKTI